MKMILILHLFLSFNLLAQEVCDDDPILSLAKGVSLPNCKTDENILHLTQRNPAPLCEDCKKNFEKVYGKISENKINVQKNFFKASLDEYKKNLTNSLLNATRLKSLLSTGGSFNKAVKACKLKTKNDFTHGCRSESAKKMLRETDFFEGLSLELSNELAKFLSTDPAFDPRPTLLKRTPNSCYIPEKDILQMAASAREEALTPEVIRALSSLNPTQFSSVSDLFEHDSIFDVLSEDQLYELKDSLYSHPYFSFHMKSPEAFSSFLKSIPRPMGLDNLRARLYGEENSRALDESLAQDCERSFTSLKEAICSDEFEQGKLFTDPQRNYSKLIPAESVPVNETLAGNEELMKKNIELLELCENKDSSDRLKLTELGQRIGLSLTKDEQQKSLVDFKSEKYNLEIGNIIEATCKMTQETCFEGTISCSIYKKFMESRVEGSLQYRLAHSSNPEVNELLRSMIGSPRELDPKTKVILVSNGILPQEDGTIIEETPTPERRPEVYAEQARQIPQTQNIARTSVTTPSAPRRPERPGMRPGQFQSPGFSGGAQNIRSGTSLADLSDIFEETNEDLRDIQDEIRRRLLERPSDKPLSRDEARTIASDTFRNRGHAITPTQRESILDRMMAATQSSEPVPELAQMIPSREEAMTTNTDSEVERWRKGQRDAALMGMAGAQAVLNQARTPASEENPTPKELTKVALNITEDPLVRLSDIFSSKLLQNDSETQLLKILLQNKNNFLLQVRSLNFRIVFNENNSFNLLFESGDPQQAERIRPQLEMFLQRLKI